MIESNIPLYENLFDKKCIYKIDLTRTLGIIAVFIAAAFFLFPFYWLITGSFKLQ